MFCFKRWKRWILFPAQKFIEWEIIKCRQSRQMSEFSLLNFHFLQNRRSSLRLQNDESMAEWKKKGNNCIIWAAEIPQLLGPSAVFHKKCSKRLFHPHFRVTAPTGNGLCRLGAVLPPSWSPGIHGNSIRNPSEIVGVMSQKPLWILQTEKEMQGLN